MNSYITSEYWMRIAVEVAKASTCRAQVGCVLVHKNTLVGMGYVGSVHGDWHCNEMCEVGDGNNDLVTDQHILVKAPHRGSTTTGTTCIRTIHAEVNAILKCTVRGSHQNGWIDCYSTYQPCLDCTKMLLQIGVRKIFYLKPYKDEWRDLFIERLSFDLESFAIKLG